MQNFGKIKNAFSEILAEGIASNDVAKKNLFKKYVKTLKESEILKTQFLVYENIENVVENDQFSANLIVSENLSLLNKFKKKDILKETLPKQPTVDVVIKNIDRKKLENQLSVDLQALFESFFTSTAKNFFGKNSQIYGVNFGVPDIAVAYNVQTGKNFLVDIDLAFAKQNKTNFGGEYPPLFFIFRFNIIL